MSEKTLFACPVCGNSLESSGNSLRCENGHCYDIARSGYVNLLMNNGSGKKRHGDDSLMIGARQRFLSKGYYQPLLDAVCRLSDGRLTTGSVILDCGCGDCWYSAGLLSYLDSAGICAECVGVDISKDALKYAAKRDERISLAVASVFRLPVAAGSCDMVMSVFAPFDAAECSRVLKRKTGLLLRLIPLEKHLMGLKRAVYEKTYLNSVDDAVPEGFEPVGSEDVRYTLTLDNNADILDLFAMTPYYYKTSAADQKKLEGLGHLETEIAVGARLYTVK